MPQSHLAYITFVDHAGAGIDNSLPGQPVYPSHGLPNPVRPDNGLPVGPPGSIGTLPVFPFDPTDPGFGNTPGQPPSATLPIQIHPGLKLVVKWVACLGFILVPDHSLPGTPEPK